MAGSSQVQLAVLGATGTIGESTFEIVRRFPERFNVKAVQVHSRLTELEPILKEFQPEQVLITGNADPAGTAKLFPKIQFNKAGEADLEAGYRSLFEGIDRVVHGIVGVAGLLPTIVALDMDVDLAIANKESLVVAGGHLPKLRAASKSLLVPVDSEHNAIFQLLQDKPGVKGVLLTSSGGPFLHSPLADLANVSVDQALKHPTWQMGPKITVDSATMVNKSLELLEAHYLFGFDLSEVKIVIHPQSIIHGMIQMDEGSFFAFLAPTSMQFPLAHAMFFPEPVPEPLFPQSKQSVDLLTDWATLEFLPVDKQKYPAVDIAYEVGKFGGTAPAIYNGANEAAVDLFLKGKIRFLEITGAIKKALDAVPSESSVDWQTCLEADRKAREFVAGI